MTELHRLWSGEMPLGRAFWIYGVIGGLAVNVTTSALFLVLVSVDWLLAAFVAGYGLSVPYNVVALVGVWRSAKHHDGDREWANVACIVTVIGMLVLTVT